MTMTLLTDNLSMKITVSNIMIKNMHYLGRDKLVVV